MRPLLLQYHTRPLRVVKYNRDGDLIITCSDDGLVNLIRADSGVRIGSYNGHKGASVKCCDINLDSTMVASGGADSYVCFYEAETGEKIFGFDHGGILKGLEFNQHPADNNEIVTCSDRFKDMPNRICIWRFDFSDNGPSVEEVCSISGDVLPLKATKVKWGPFDETIISIHEEGQFFVWDREGYQVRKVDAHHMAITGMQFNLDRTLMATCSRDATVKLWEMQEHGLVKEYKTNRPLNDCSISPLYDDKENPKFHIIAGGGVEAIHAATTAEGGFETVLFNMVLEEEVGTIKGHFGPMNSCCFCPDGRSYCTGGEEGLIRIIQWDKDYYERKDL